MVFNWPGWLGYTIALIVLLGSEALPWIELLFPLWVLLVSGYVLNATFQPRAAEGRNQPLQSVPLQSADSLGD